MRRQVGQVPVQLEGRQDRKVVVRGGGRVCGLRRGTGPNGVHVGGTLASAVFIERDEEGGPRRREHRAVENLRQEALQVGVPRRHGTVVHVVAQVRREPHVVRSGRRRGEVVQQRAVPTPGRDDATASGSVVDDVAEVDERIVADRIPARVAAVTAARHVFHVRLPRQTCVDEKVHDVLGFPSEIRAGVRVGISIVAATTEVLASRQAQVVREARPVAVNILRGQPVCVREGRHVRAGAAARREDVADRVILHHDNENIVEVGPRRYG